MSDDLLVSDDTARAAVRLGMYAVAAVLVFWLGLIAAAVFLIVHYI